MLTLSVKAQQVALTRGRGCRFERVHLGSQRCSEASVIRRSLRRARSTVELVQYSRCCRQRGGIAIEPLLQECQRIIQTLALV